MVKGYFRIGDIPIYIEASENLVYPQNLEKFRIDEKKEDADSNTKCRYGIHMEADFTSRVEYLKALRTGPVYKREDLTVFQTTTGECRLMNFKGTDGWYAASLQRENDKNEIWFSRQIQNKLSLDTIFWAPFCLERLMIERDGVILHSAYMERNGEAILFSAPSGTGKSTQAFLWEKYRHTRTINGDRTLLQKKDGIWHAYGWPICGSSEICINESFAIRAIVMLRQAKTNQIRRLYGFEAVRGVLSQLMVNGWSHTFQEKAFECLNEILEEIPVYLLSCDISEQAVECLENVLKNEA